MMKRKVFENIAFWAILTLALTAEGWVNFLFGPVL